MTTVVVLMLFLALLTVADLLPAIAEPSGPAVDRPAGPLGSRRHAVRLSRS